MIKHAAPHCILLRGAGVVAPRNNAPPAELVEHDSVFMHPSELFGSPLQRAIDLFVENLEICLLLAGPCFCSMALRTQLVKNPVKITEERHGALNVGAQRLDAPLSVCHEVAALMEQPRVQHGLSRGLLGPAARLERRLRHRRRLHQAGAGAPVRPSSRERARARGDAANGRLGRVVQARGARSGTGAWTVVQSGHGVSAIACAAISTTSKPQGGHGRHSTPSAHRRGGRASAA
mmetsp:Transcript_139923/g.390042  ORF Transcript_139923/g.390042 Transcript_139923/m.390042 type:complete len:234 (-) Transcript_139923:1139-1840(-)